MFIAIDIGNTDITLGVLIGEEWNEYRFSSDASQLVEHYEDHFLLLKQNLPEEELVGIVLSSVVPQLTPLVSEACKFVFHKKPVLLEKKWYNKLPVTPNNPDEIGTDLVANALAAWTLIQNKLLIVDFGTALTYTYLNQFGVIEGVSIAPGIRTSINALSSKAAQLPEINLDLPEQVLGTNTVEAMKAGILWGYVGQVQFMIKKIKQEKGSDLKVIATGGLSEVLQPLKNSFDIIDKKLTLKGLYNFHQIMIQ